MAKNLKNIITFGRFRFCKLHAYFTFLESNPQKLRQLNEKNSI